MLYLVIFKMYHVVCQKDLIFFKIHVTYTKLFIGPDDPTCSGGLVSSFSNNSITIDLTNVKTGNRSRQLCMHYVPPSSFGNVSCVNKTRNRIKIPGLQSGTRYSFSIYASIPTQNGRIESLDGCRNITQYTCMY